MEKVIYELGLGESNGVATPGIRDETTVSASEPGLSDAAAEEEGWPPLSGAELSRYQSLDMSLNYFSLDRLGVI